MWRQRSPAARAHQHQSLKQLRIGGNESVGKPHHLERIVETGEPDFLVTRAKMRRSCGHRISDMDSRSPKPALFLDPLEFRPRRISDRVAGGL